MGGIDDKADAIVIAKDRHLVQVHSAREVDAVHKVNLLSVGAGRVEVGRSCVFEFLHHLAAFCRSTEYENHEGVPFLKRWVKCLL